MRCNHVIVAVVLLNSILNADSSCSGTIRKSSEENQPIYMRKTPHGDYSFLMPQNGLFSFMEEENFVFGCPNEGNTLSKTTARIALGVCRRNKLLVAGRIYNNVAEAQCSESVQADVKQTKMKCGNNEGLLYNIGYSIDKDTFATLMDICYDGNKTQTLYTDHTIRGKSITYRTTVKRKSVFSEEGMGTVPYLSAAYQTTYQSSKIAHILGSEALAHLYVDYDSYLCPARLVPPDDFYFATWQNATFLYINTAPVWQIIRDENLRRIEAMIRSAASVASTSIRVYTGPSGNLKLEDNDHHHHPIFLLPSQKLPVPKFIWKIVQYQRSAIVIIIANNPFLNFPTLNDYFCACICKEYGWFRDTWEMSRRGLVHCCDYKSFRKLVPTVPQLDITSILSFKSD